VGLNSPTSIPSTPASLDCYNTACAARKFAEVNIRSNSSPILIFFSTLLVPFACLARFCKRCANALSFTFSFQPVLKSNPLWVDCFLLRISSSPDLQALHVQSFLFVSSPAFFFPLLSKYYDLCWLLPPHLYIAIRLTSSALTRTSNSRMTDLRGKTNRFQVICSLHLPPAYLSSIGLLFDLQHHPMQTALYVVSVRWTNLLLTASFRFHLAMDTLAVQLTLPTTKRVRDFHPIAINHASHTSFDPIRAACGHLL